VPLVACGKDLLGTPAAYPPMQLRLHPVFIHLGLVGSLINQTVYGRRPPETVPEPILITSSGIVISGIREWHAAVSEGRHAVNCTEYQLSDDEALQVILILQQSRGVWNAFTRVQIALQQEPYLQTKAHANQVVGGKDKGWANLPEARQIEVRQEIAYLAGACPRNVSKVKAILLKAHPRLIEACQTGVVTIHCASKLCRRPKDEQLEDLTHYLNRRSNGKTTRQAIAILIAVPARNSRTDAMIQLKTHRRLFGVTGRLLGRLCSILGQHWTCSRVNAAFVHARKLAQATAPERWTRPLACSFRPRSNLWFREAIPAKISGTR